MNEAKRFEMCVDAAEGDLAVAAWIDEETRREEAATVVMVKAVVAEVHAHLHHMGGLVPECAAREAIAAGIEALGRMILDPPHPKDEDIEATLARLRDRHQRELARAQRVAEATFHRVIEECDSYDPEDDPPPSPRSLS